MKVDISNTSYDVARCNAELSAIWCERMIEDINVKLEILKGNFVKQTTDKGRFRFDELWFPKIDYIKDNLFMRFHEAHNRTP